MTSEKNPHSSNPEGEAQTAGQEPTQENPASPEVRGEHDFESLHAELQQIEGVLERVGELGRDDVLEVMKWISSLQHAVEEKQINHPEFSFLYSFAADSLNEAVEEAISKDAKFKSKLQRQLDALERVHKLYKELLGEKADVEGKKKPSQWLDLQRVKGIGPEGAQALVDHGVDSLQELRKRAQDGTLRKIPGFGPEMEGVVLKTVQEGESGEFFVVEEKEGAPEPGEPEELGESGVPGEPPPPPEKPMEPEKPEEEPEPSSPESYRQDLREAVEDLRNLIERGRRKLDQEGFNPFQTQEGENQSEKPSYYQRLLDQEEYILVLQEGLLEDLKTADIPRKEKVALEIKLKQMAEEALNEAKNFRQKEFIPSYFGFDHIETLSDLVDQSDDLRSGRENPENFNNGDSPENFLDLVSKEIAKLEWAQGLKLAPEDESLIEKKLSDMRQKFKILEKAKQYHEEYLEFKDRKENQEVEAIANEVDDAHIDISTRPVERTASETLSFFENRDRLLENHRERLEKEIEDFAEGSAARAEANSLLAKINQAIEKNKEMHTLVQEAQLRIYEQKPEIVQLQQKINDIMAIEASDVEGDLTQKPGLEVLKQGLEEAVQAAQNVQNTNLLSSAVDAGYPENEMVEEKIEEINQQLKDARNHIEEVIRAADKESGILSQLDEKWETIVGSDAPTKGAKATEDNIRLKKEILKLAEQLPDGERRRKKWEIKMKVWDGFLKVAGDDIIRELAFPDAEKARRLIAGEVNMDEIRELLKNPEMERAVEMVENIFFAGTIKFVDLGGNPLRHPETGELMVDENGEPYTHNYARKGNPSSQEVGMGRKLELGDYLKALLPNSISSDLFTTKLIAILGELRHKVEVGYYSLYAETPTTYDLAPIRQAATMAYILYKVRSGSYIREEYWSFFGSVSLHTKKTGIYGDMPTERVGVGGSEEMVNIYAEDVSRRERVKEIEKRSQDLYFQTNAEEQIRVLQTIMAERPEDPEEGKARGFKPAKETGNVREALQAREIADDLISSIDFDRVPIPWDYQHMPMLWDILRAEPGAAYQQLTFVKYDEICQAWEGFLEQIEHVPDVRSEKDLRRALSEGVNKFAANKGMLGAIKDSPYEDFYHALLKQLYLRYTKDLFDQFNTLSPIVSEPLRIKKFIKVAREQYESPGTYPDFLEEFILEVFDLALSPGGLLGKSRDVLEGIDADESRKYSTLFTSKRPALATYRADTSDLYKKYYLHARIKQESEEGE